MKNHKPVLVFFALLACLSMQVGQACTTFLLEHDDQNVFGRNYDWSVDDGLIITNKRNIAKTATTEQNPAKWTSKYGSITFNQFGREMPLGGMNEAGLVVEVMWLVETEYPAADSIPTLNNLQWVQYQLDNFSTVKQVLASDSLVTVISDNSATIHYLVADATGDCASIEFLDGKAVYHTGEEMPVPVLTNNTYEESEQFLHGLKPFGGAEPIPQGFGSLARFARAARYIRRYRPEDSVPIIDYAFAALSSVSSGMYTKWSIVYDIPNLRIYFRTFANQQIRHLDLASFDFSGSTPAKMLDINARLSGDVARDFIDYTSGANRDLIFNVFHRVEFLKAIPDEQLEALAQYPETTRYIE